MKTIKSFSRTLIQSITISIICIFMGVFVGCNLLPIDEGEAIKLTQLRETELNIHVEQTLLAQQQEERDQQKTQEAPVTPDLNLPVTPPASENQPLPATEMPAVTSPPTPVEESPLEPTGDVFFDEARFKDWLADAKILLYEDMTARLDTVRYVKGTLDAMGLSYKDDGSAFGWLLSDLEQGPKNGDQWDLIILASEDKDGIKADHFSAALKAIDQGASVILEVYYLDGAYNSSASGLLSRCGIIYEGNLIRIPPAGSVFFPLNPEHPILNTPNSGLGFSSTTGFWWDSSGEKSYDTGDLVKLAPDSEATLLLGTTPNNRNAHGTSTVCMDGQLIVQSFSSHVLTYKTMSPLWENYIYNALRTRFLRSLRPDQPH